MPQPGGFEHATPSIEHVPPTSGQVVVQARPVALQVLLRSQSGLVAKHAVRLIVHSPFCVGHSPRSMPGVWQIAPMTIEQCPAFGHSAVVPGVVQSLPSLLHRPGISGHSAVTPGVRQVAKTVVLQCPSCSQSSLIKQPGLPSREQVPGLGRHWVAALARVQEMAVSMLHFPVVGQVFAAGGGLQAELSVLHFPVQSVRMRHARHSSPVHGQ
jgi:hypothetical protein